MNRGRWGMSLLLGVALALTAGMRLAVSSFQTRISPAISGEARLSQLNSFSLGLFLGGLRGPLVMYLWPSVENQKSAKDLEDIDTKIEMIRLLQAQYDSVHLFQIWNKAWNLSVQMASKANKYAAILDGLAYGRRVDRERPDNINILYAIGNVYFDKLGSSAEKRYYIDRVRGETLPLVRLSFPAARMDELLKAATARAVPLTANDVNTRQGTAQVTLRKLDADLLRDLFGGEGVHYEYKPRLGETDRTVASRHEQILDADGRIFPELLRPDGRRRPTTSDGQTVDGAELQFLRDFDAAGGFPYGVPPHALGYNYFKKAQIFQLATGQKHIQLGDIVLERQPAVALKGWAEEDWERALRLELRAFGRPAPQERLAMELPTAGLDRIVSPLGIPEALHFYERAALVADASLREYEGVVNRHTLGGGGVYTSHRDTMHAVRELLRADGAYLRAVAGDPRREELLRTAAEHYRQTIDAYLLITLSYYVEDEVAAAVYPTHTVNGAARQYTKQTIRNLDPKHFPTVYARVVQFIHTPKPAGRGGEDLHRDDRTEYETYMRRAAERLDVIQRLLATTAPTTAPTTTPASR